MLCEFYYPFDRGGAEWSSHYLAQGLKEQNHEVKILTPNYGTKAEEIYESVPIYRYPYYLKLHNRTQKVSPMHQTNPLWHFLLFIFLIREILFFKPDVLHIQGKYMMPVAVIVGKLFGLKTVLTLRDYILLCPYGFCINQERSYKVCSLCDLYRNDIPIYINNNYVDINIAQRLFVYISGLFGWLYARMQRVFIPYVDEVVGISESMSRIYTKNNVYVNRTIYNSVQLPQRIRSENENTIVFSGRVSYGKGVDLLLDAYEKLTKSFRNLPKLLIVGQSQMLERQKKIKNVRFLGRRPYNEVLHIMASARLVIVPSRWEEPFGRVALEALYLGIPCVVTNRGGLPEIIEDTKYGVVVQAEVADLAQGIRQALHNEQYFRKVISESRKKIERKYTIEPIKQYLDIYA